MDKTTMDIIVIEPNIEPYIKKIPKNLDSLRELVGNTELEIFVYEKDALIVFDDKALIRGLPINRYIDSKAIRGVFVITGNDARVKDFADITQEQIDKYTQQFSLEQEVEQEF